MAVPYSFTTLLSNFPTDSREDLYREMGWDSIIDNPNYENTCAIRVSICLLRCGMSLGGGELKIWKGPLQGKRVKIRFDDLAEFLKGEWGEPKVFEPGSRGTLHGQQGVITFWELPSGYGGHIDLLSRDAQCAHACYFGSARAWLWTA